MAAGIGAGSSARSRNCAIIAGLIERRFPGKEKTGRQVTVSTDLVYDVLRRHQPDHILLEAAWADAASGLLDIARLSDMLRRIEERRKSLHRRLDRVSPLAVPVLLDIGKEPIYGEAREEALRMAADELAEEAEEHDRGGGGGVRRRARRRSRSPACG